jgi:hypothetical protein
MRVFAAGVERDTPQIRHVRPHGYGDAGGTFTNARRAADTVSLAAHALRDPLWARHASFPIRAVPQGFGSQATPLLSPPVSHFSGNLVQ